MDSIVQKVAEQTLQKKSITMGTKSKVQASPAGILKNKFGVESPTVQNIDFGSLSDDVLLKAVTTPTNNVGKKPFPVNPYKKQK